MGTRIHPRPLAEIAESIKTRKVTVAETTEDVLRRIDRYASQLNCFITVMSDSARTHARALDQLLEAGIWLGPLHGLTVAIKDNTATKGIRTTAGSAILRDWIPEFDATVVRRLKAAGAVILGKTNLYEFAAGGIHSLYGDVRNPWDMKCSSGASSSGSACAVAAGLAHLATGSDTGGSIRLPAAVCGVVGFKPTFGLVSRHGVIPGSYNLDHVGLLARDVWGVAALLSAVAGSASFDSTTVHAPPLDYTAALDTGVAGFRLGVPRLDREPIDPDLVDGIGRALELLEQQGAKLVEIDLPNYAEARTIMLAIHAAECAEYHQQHLKRRRKELSQGVRALLELGELVTAPEYVRCQRVRQRHIRQVAEAQQHVDVIVLPTLPISAWPADASVVEIGAKVEPIIPAITRYTPIFNLTGQPAISVPCGFGRNGLPFGLQFAGRPREDGTVLRVARTYEALVGGFEVPGLNEGETTSVEGGG